MVTGMNCQRTIDPEESSSKWLVRLAPVQTPGRSRGLVPVARLKTTTFSNTINVMVKPHDRLVPVS